VEGNIKSFILEKKKHMTSHSNETPIIFEYPGCDLRYKWKEKL
jgi:hypothetical protein